MNGAGVASIVGVVAFGAALGSFANVVIDRMPVALEEPDEFGSMWRTRPWREVLGGRSRCSDCGTGVRPVDNIPVLSWLVLRGRCRACGARIPAFHLVVELVVPALLALTWVRLVGSWTVVVALWMVLVGVVLAVIDLRTFVLPTRIIWPAMAVAVVLAGVAAAAAREPGWMLSGVVGTVAFAGPLFVMWFVHPAGQGFGDVRLAVLLGWCIGVVGGRGDLALAAVLPIVGIALAALLGLVFGVVVIGARGMKARVPFGPALVAASIACMWWSEQWAELLGR